MTSCQAVLPNIEILLLKISSEKRASVFRMSQMKKQQSHSIANAVQNHRTTRITHPKPLLPLPNYTKRLVKKSI